ncbi:hypothetical protein KBX06_10135 [Micromonospora sp. C31]|uniref:hypothetical protein n=1 Tax=Micromonospora sp. C31 TaxID=2824876 RepID=UPI001B394F7C|nr:hypothetical protein [Micromonospora sp. C31]MBQ1073518.1 hypothetical protein [Micromonospora sp. C31]
MIDLAIPSTTIPQILEAATMLQPHPSRRRARHAHRPDVCMTTAAALACARQNDTARHRKRVLDVLAGPPDSLNELSVASTATEIDTLPVLVAVFRSHVGRRVVCQPLVARIVGGVGVQVRHGLAPADHVIL